MTRIISCDNIRTEQNCKPQQGDNLIRNVQLNITRYKKTFTLSPLKVLPKTVNFDPGWGGGYFGVKRIGMTVGNPRKLP